MILLDLFFCFVKIGLFSIGGGYAAMPLIESQVVEQYGWLSMSEFADLVTIAEMTPGPITVNAATFVGIRLAGVLGAVVATLGCVLPAVLIVSLLGKLYLKYSKASALQTVLGSLRPAIVALIAAAGLRIILQVLWQGERASLSGIYYPGVVLMVGAFLLIRKVKWSPILVMLLCGAANLLFGVLTGAVSP